MTTTVHQRSRLYLASEVGGYSVDPDATGAAYLPVRTMGNLTLSDHKKPLPTDYFTGRNAHTPAEIGADAWQLVFEIPLLGLSTAAGSGQAPPAEDHLDYLFDCAFGAKTDYSGTTVSAATSSTLTTAASNAGLQDLLCVVDPNANSGRAQWARSSSSASPYNIAPSWVATPTATGVAYGVRRWGPLSTPGGNSLSMYLDIDSANGGSAYTLTGGRVTALKLSMPTGEIAKLSVTMRGDVKSSGTKGSIPAFAAWSGTDIKGLAGAFGWGNTFYDTANVEVDWTIAGSDSASIAAAQGRSNIENLRSDPIITVTPLFSESVWAADFRAAVTRNLLVKYGAGTLSSGVIDTCAFFAEAAQIMAAPTNVNDGNRVRQSVKFQAVDAGLTGSTAYRLWQFLRA